MESKRVETQLLSLSSPELFSFRVRTQNSSLMHFFAHNPVHPNINMHILHTALCTFPKVLTRRICLTIKMFFSW